MSFLNKSVCIIGNLNNQNLNTQERSEIKKTLHTEIEKAIKSGYINFISGMNLGFETWGADIVLKFKKQYPGIKLECFLAYEEIMKDWKEYQRNKFFNIIERCDKETLLQYAYTYGCVKICYRHMINRSSLIIAGLDKNIFSDCIYAVKYAEQRGIEVIK